MTAIPLTSSSIVSVPVRNTGKVMESSKEPGHLDNLHDKIS